jgi:hypothetical protein
MGRGRFQVLLALLRLSHAAAAPSHRHHGHSGHHLKNVTVRVRACDAPIKIANLGYLGPTKMNHLEYFSRAYAQPRYRSAAPSAGTYDLDYVPWNCLTELARATCPGGPALGSFSVLPFTVYGKKQPKVTHNSKIAALRETLCPGAKVDPGRFALLGTELPTRKVTSKGYAEIWDRFPYASLKFTVPRPAVGHHALVNGVCVTRPAAPRPGESRRFLAAFMGLPRSAFGGLRDRLVRECEGAADCATTTTGFAAHHKPDPVTTYGNATFALQPWGDTATRKGFWDALAVGAVNVVFAPRGDKVPYGMYADEFVGRHETFTITIPESVWSTGGTLAYLRNIPSSRILELQRGALRARARAMYTTEGDCRDANFAIASVLAERFRAHQAKKAGF